MNIWDQFKIQALKEDGDWLTFITHKIVHVAVGCLFALPAYDMGAPAVVGFLMALIVGIIREIPKDTPMLLHAVTATITMLGALPALLLSGYDHGTQAIWGIALIFYCAFITWLQLTNRNI